MPKISQKGGFFPKWLTVLDIDFTSLGTIDISTDGAKTIDGLSMTKFNSTNDNTAMALTSAGLVMIPKAGGTDYDAATRNFPGLYCALSQFVPATRVDPTISVRLWTYMSSYNFNANQDALVMAFDQNNSQLSYVMKIGRNNAGNAGATLNIISNSTNSGYLDNAFTIPGSGTNLVSVFEVTSLNGPACKYYTGSYSSGWPQVNALTAYSLGYGSGSFNCTLWSGTTMGFSIGAMRKASATALSLNIQRLRVDVAW